VPSRSIPPEYQHDWRDRYALWTCRDCGFEPENRDIGVIEFEGGGSGQAKKPKLAYDGLEIDIPFAEPSESVGTEAP